MSGASMSPISGMPTWMPAPGQTWLGAWAGFVGMWVVMMAPMMVVSFGPTVWRHRRERARDVCGLAAGYVLAWTVLGALAFPVTTGRSASLGVALIAAGMLQFAPWKRPGRADAASTAPRTALRRGLGLGLHCIRSCAGSTIVMLSAGLMDARAMFVLTAAIAAERLVARAGFTRSLGAVAVVVGAAICSTGAGMVHW